MPKKKAKRIRRKFANRLARLTVVAIEEREHTPDHQHTPDVVPITPGRDIQAALTPDHQHTPDVVPITPGSDIEPYSPKPVSRSDIA